MKAKAAPGASKEPISAVVYRINILLHTMRAIERHEDQLCIIMTEIKNSGAITAKLDEELRGILEEMPAHEYLDDIDAVRTSLSPELLSSEGAGAGTRPSKSPAKRSPRRKGDR